MLLVKFYKPIVYTEQKIFCHLVNEKAVDWLISLEGGIIIPSEVLNHLQSAQQLLFSVTPAIRGETTQILWPCGLTEILFSVKLTFSSSLTGLLGHLGSNMYLQDSRPESF